MGWEKFQQTCFMRNNGYRAQQKRCLWGRVRALEASEAFWGQLGVVLGGLGAILKLLGRVLEPHGAVLEPLGVVDGKRLRACEKRLELL